MKKHTFVSIDKCVLFLVETASGKFEGSANDIDTFLTASLEHEKNRKAAEEQLRAMVSTALEEIRAEATANAELLKNALAEFAEVTKTYDLHKPNISQ